MTKPKDEKKKSKRDHEHSPAKPGSVRDRREKKLAEAVEHTKKVVEAIQ